ncbi:hypothetical protein QCA50_016403 [Cerrena zonata]|uniref:Uncharacterized protein n=1 Tax=Cerrena zonata TaxID=2478898 RepID=A0AAW0FIP7_9APHY
MAGACPCVLSTTLPYIPQLDKEDTSFLCSENSARIELSLTQMQVLQCSYHLPVLSRYGHTTGTLYGGLNITPIILLLNDHLNWCIYDSAIDAIPISRRLPTPLSQEKNSRTTVEVKTFVAAITIWLNRCIRWSTWL